jgi:hypothetical protein
MQTHYYKSPNGNVDIQNAQNINLELRDLNKL